MTTLEPDPESGLSGKRLLFEDLAPLATNAGADPTDPGVYVLELSTPAGSDHEEYHRRWLDHFDAVPEWLGQLADHDRLWYVGAAASVRDRIEQHLRHPNQSASVCRPFPVHHVETVRWADSADDAFTWEHGVALSLREDTDDIWVHCR